MTLTLGYLLGAYLCGEAFLKGNQEMIEEGNPKGLEPCRELGLQYAIATLLWPIILPIWFVTTIIRFIRILRGQ